MSGRRLIYEGKHKILYEGGEPFTLVQHFKDEVSAHNNQKKGLITGKGALNNRISGLLMSRIQEIGIPTHFIRHLNMREQLVHAIEMFPFRIIVRNMVAGSLSQRFKLEEGLLLPRPLIEFSFHSDTLENPLVSDDHIIAFGWADPEELDQIVAYAYRINDFLTGHFLAIGLKLVDLSLEFGRYQNEEESLVVLADEISPDSCRLWDVKTGKKLDRDRFVEDLGQLAEAYQEVAKRLGIFIEPQETFNGDDKGGVGSNSSTSVPEQ